MKKSFITTLGAALLALILLFGFSAWLFSHNMSQARHKSEERMEALAIYIGEHIKEDVFSYPFEVRPEEFPTAYADQQNKWLERLTNATGLERAVITDSLGKVYVGSQNLISLGDDILPYLLDSSLFRKAAKENRPVFTPLTVIDGVNFQSLYFPFAFHEKQHMIVLESDQNFIAYVEQFKNYLWFASLFMVALFAVLTGGLFILDRKFQKALEVSRRNEHLAFLGRTSAELAHELKNPLAIIKASVDVLRKKLDPKGEEKAFKYLSEETMRLSRLIGNILGFSKEQKLEIKPFQPRGALLELREMHRMDFPEVEWEIDLASDLIIMGDRDAFRQIADNLARNASNAMKGRGNFKVTFQVLEKKEKQISPFWKKKNASQNWSGEIVFTDNGAGLPDELRDKLFEPFVTGSKTGTGLGLAIVKSLCEKMGWVIYLKPESKEGQVSFAIRLTPEKMVIQK